MALQNNIKFLTMRAVLQVLGIFEQSKAAIMALRKHLTKPIGIAAIGAILLMGTYGFGAISLPVALGSVFTLGLGARFLNPNFFMNLPFFWQKRPQRAPMNVAPVRRNADDGMQRLVDDLFEPEETPRRPQPLRPNPIHFSNQPKPQDLRTNVQRVLDGPVKLFDNAVELQKNAQRLSGDTLVHFMTSFHRIFASCVTLENKKIFNDEFNNYFSLDGKEVYEIFNGIESAPAYRANKGMLTQVILNKIQEMLAQYKADPLSAKVLSFNPDSANADFISKITEVLGATTANMLFFEQGKRIHACATLEEKRKEMLKFTQKILLSKDVQETIAALPKPSLKVLKHEIVQQKGGEHVKAWLEAAQREQDLKEAKPKNRP